MLIKLHAAPQTIISCGVFLAAVGAVLSLIVSTSQPWLGIKFVESEGVIFVESVHAESPGRHSIYEQQTVQGFLTPTGDIYSMKAVDFYMEPDSLNTYSEYNRFFDRQATMSGLLSDQTITLLVASTPVEIQPLGYRPINSLPSLFWFQLVFGCLTLSLGLGVWAFKPHSTATFMLALSGLGLYLAALPSAIYATRELALDADPFQTLSLINQAGTYIFCAAFIGTLWHYPRKIHRFPMVSFLLIAYSLCWLLNYFQVYTTLDAGMRYPVFAGFLATACLAVLQWRKTSEDPVARASLKWFLLAWFLGSSLFLLLVMIPVTLGLKPFISQGVAFGFLIFLYAGVTMSIIQYRLFDLERWWFEAWVWLIGGVLVLGVDLILLYFLHLRFSVAIVLSVAIVGWAYFPFRQWLWGKLAWGKQMPDFRKIFPNAVMAAVDYAVRPGPQWMDTLNSALQPIALNKAPDNGSSVKILDNGLTLYVPAIPHQSPINISCAARGRRLFSKHDVDFVNSLSGLFRQTVRYRTALEEGAYKERLRVARDLHDDVGSQLLTHIYQLDNETEAEQARSILKELRIVISELEADTHPLRDILDELRAETAQRCDISGIRFHWHEDETINGARIDIDSRIRANLRSVLREAVSNAIKHADSDELEISLRKENDQLHCTLTDNGKGFDLHSKSHRRGVNNMKQRIDELGGMIKWTSLPDGTRVSWVMPLGVKI